MIKDAESLGLKDFGVLLESVEAELGVMFKVEMRISGMSLERVEGVFGVMLEAVEVVLRTVLAATREVLRVVSEPVALLLNKTDAGNKGRLDCELSEPVAAERLATPIVILAVETEALCERSVAKGMGE